MNSSKVIHLVSNALEHPENTPNDFKVSYNIPFDLTGKKIALVDATLTKGQANVLEETITFQHSRNKKIVKHKELMSNISNHLENEVFRDKATLEKRHVFQIQRVVNCHTNFFDEAPGQVTFMFDNGSKHSITITAPSFIEEHSSAKWTIVMFGVGKRKSQPLDDEEKIMNTLTIPPYKHSLMRFNFKNKVFKNLNEVFDFTRSNGGLQIKLMRYRQVVERGEFPQPPPTTFQPGPGNFKDIHALINQLNSMKGFLAIGKLRIENGKVGFFIKRNSIVKSVDWGGLEYHLGFDKREIQLKNTRKLIAQRPPDMTRGTHHFYIYCSLVKNIAVNNKMLQILATVDATKGNYGEQVVHPVQYPLFLECVEGPQQVVEVTISDDMGNSKKLLVGRTKLTLAVRDD